MIGIIGKALYQWDTGRYVSVTDIEADHVHIANKGDSKAPIMELSDSKAKIPDYLLQTGKQICVYAVKDGITVESKTFSVTLRERPENYVYEDDQRNYIYELIQSAEVAVEAATLATESANSAAQNASASAGNADSAAGAATKAAEDAQKASYNANEAATKATQAAKALMVVGKAEGTNIHLDDAIDQVLVGAKIFGKTTQNGTPTPDVPVELVSVGDSGSITVNVTGENDAKSMTIATPNGLPGIPVTSGGNYTDANGQQWVCDEIDFARGVYVQRIQEIDEFDAVETLDLNTKYMKRAAYEMLGKLDCPFGLCTHTNAYNYHSLDTTHFYIDLRDAWVYLPTGSDVSNLKVYAILTNPIEIPLSEEEIATFNVLYTYRGNTTISNDASAPMEIEYVMDAKKYISRLVYGTIHPATVE